MYIQMNDDDNENHGNQRNTAALLRYKNQMSVYRFDCTINTLLIAFHGQHS